MERATRMALSGSCSRGGAWSWPDQLAHQPVGEIVEVVQPLAQIGIGGAQHAGAGVGLHALDAGFGGEAGHHRLAQPVQPALVMREHAVGFEHLAMLAAVGDSPRSSIRSRSARSACDRVVEPLELLLRRRRR